MKTVNLTDEYTKVVSCPNNGCLGIVVTDANTGFYTYLEIACEEGDESAVKTLVKEWKEKLEWDYRDRCSYNRNNITNAELCYRHKDGKLGLQVSMDYVMGVKGEKVGA